MLGISLATVKTGLSKIQDPLSRLMLWTTLWEMARDAKWPVTDYADLVLSSAEGEPDLKIATHVLQTLYGRHPWSQDRLRCNGHADQSCRFQSGNAKKQLTTESTSYSVPCILVS